MLSDYVALGESLSILSRESFFHFILKCDPLPYFKVKCKASYTS